MEFRGIKPESLLAVFLGASAYEDSPNLADGSAFYNSANDFRNYLRNTYGVPRKNIKWLFDDSHSPSDQLNELARFLSERCTGLKAEGSPAEDLLIYYVGHGLFAREQYCLAIRATKENNEAFSSIRGADLAGVVKENARLLRRFLILDCCFSAAIYKDFQFQTPPMTIARTQVIKELPLKGTSLLCSSNAGDPSFVSSRLGRTMFSDALIMALTTGDISLGNPMSFSELADLVRENLKTQYDGSWARPEVHSPDQREGDIAQLPMFPNPACRSATADSERETQTLEWAQEERLEREKQAQARAEQERLEQEEQEQAKQVRQAAEAERARKEAEIRAKVEAERSAKAQARRERKQAIAQGRIEGTSLFKTGDIAGAIAILDKLIQEYPDSDEVQKDREAAVTELARREREEAEAAQLKAQHQEAERIQKEAEARAKAEAERRAQQEAERARQAAEARARKEAEKRERAEAARKAEEAERARQAAEAERARKEAEERDKAEAARKAEETKRAPQAAKAKAQRARSDAKERACLAPLPRLVQEAIESPFPAVREDIVRTLDVYLRGGNEGLALAAREALRRLMRDETRRIASAARECINAFEAQKSEKLIGEPEDDLTGINPEPTVANIPGNREKQQQLLISFGEQISTAWTQRKSAVIILTSVVVAMLVIIVWAVTSSDNEKSAESNPALLETRCSSGDAKSCYDLGMAYDNGTGVPMDKAHAARIYNQACDAGMAVSCNNLGNLYEDGTGASMDKVHAAQLYRQACDGGLAAACNNLARSYENGSGVPKDETHAAQLYRRACDGGVAAGCNKLGQLLDDGTSSPKNKARASQLYKQACEGGDSYGCANLENIKKR